MLMLLLIWCGALCSFTDPSLWLLHSRSPPAPPPQMIVSTRALLSVRLCVPQVRPRRVNPLPPPPSALCGCRVLSSCPMHPHSSVTLSPAVSFFSSSYISSPFPGHLSALWYLRWLQHGAFPSWLGQGPYFFWLLPQQNVQSKVRLPTPFYTHSPESDTLLLPV